MNPFVRDVLGGIVRAVLAGAFGLLVAGGLISASDSTRYAEAAAPIVVAVGLSAYQKYTARQKLVTALGSTQMLSEKQLTDSIAAGASAPVTTPVHDVPVVEVAKPQTPATAKD
jgi:hypothetical protein